MKNDSLKARFYNSISRKNFLSSTPVSLEFPIHINNVGTPYALVLLDCGSKFYLTVDPIEFDNRDEVGLLSIYGRHPLIEKDIVDRSIYSIDISSAILHIMQINVHGFLIENGIKFSCKEYSIYLLPSVMPTQLVVLNENSLAVDGKNVQPENNIMSYIK